MASDIGNVYLDVYADTSALKKQIRAAAKAAGKEFGREFDKAAAPGLSGIGERLVRSMGKSGRLSGKEFASEFRNQSKGIALGFDEDIAKAFATGDWDTVFANFATLDEAVERTSARISELNKGGSLTKGLKELDVTVDDLRGSMNAYADEARASGEATKQATEQEKQRTALLDRLSSAMKANEQAQKAQNEALKQALTKQAAQDTARLKNEHDNLQRALTKSTQEMKAFNTSGKDVDANVKKIRSLNTEYEALQNRLRKVVQEHNVMTAGMDKNSEQYVAAVAKQRKALDGLNNDLRALNKQKITLKVDVDTPSSAEVKARGALLGRVFGKAFQSGSGSGGGAIGGMIDDLSSKWKEFSTAFPAEITILIRYFLFLIGPISTVGSALGSVLLPLVGALSVALVGLAAAIGGIGAAAAFSFALAKKSMDVFKESFPETQKAIDNLKDAFEKVDVPAFAEQWAESLKNFSNTLADSLKFDTVAENLGRATASITDAFTAVLQSPAWTGFVDAIEGPLASALAGIGTGLAGLFGVALQWMTAAAPLAQALGEQFSTWATNLNAALASEAGQAQLTAFFGLVKQILDGLVPLVTNLTSAISNIFLAGASTGAGFLQTLAALAAQFNAWTSSAAGQEALNQLFRQAQTVFDALVPLIGALGTAFAAMVTPATVQSLIIFMNAITQILPIFSQLIVSLSELGAFEILAVLLQTVFTAIQPLIPVIGELAGLIGGQLALIIANLAPVLGDLVSALAPVLVTFGELIAVVGPAISQVFAALSPVFAALGPVVQVLLQALMPLIPIFVNLITIVANLVSAILPPLMPVIAAIGELFAALAPVIAEIGGKIAGLLVQAVTLLAPLLVQLVPVIMSLVEAFMPIIDIVFDLASTFIDALMPVIRALIPIIGILAPTFVQLVIAITPVLRVVQLLAPVLDVLLPILSSLIVMFLNLLTPILMLIEPILTFVVQLFAAKGAVADVLKGLGKFAEGVLVVAGKVGKFFTGVGDDIAKFLGNFGRIFTNIGTKITEFIGKVVKFGEDIVLGLLGGLEAAWLGVVGWFGGAIEGLINLFKSLFGIASPSSVFADFGDMIITGLLNGITAAWNAVVSFFTGIGETVKGWFAGALDWLKGLGEDIINGLFLGIQTVWDTYVAIWSVIGDTIKGWFEGALEWLKQIGSDIFQGLFNGIQFVWDTYVAIWSVIGTTIKGWFTGAITWLKQIGSDIFTGLFNGIKELWDREVRGWQRIGETIKGWFTGAATWLKQIGSDIIGGLLSGLETAWTNVSSWVSGIAGKIQTLAGSGLEVLKQAGKNIIDGFLAGLKASWEKVKDFVGGIGDWIADHKGPKQFDLRLLQPAGGWIMEGLQTGIRGALPDLRRTLQDVTGAINVGGAASFGVNPARGAGGNVGPIGWGGGGTTVASGAIQIVTPVRDPAIVASMVLDGLVAKAQ